MARAGFVGRHRTAIASGAALLLAAGAVVAYAVTADGYKAHEAELNDGGVWVVNGDLGWSGRINKPINQLDGVVVGEGPKLRLDVLQDGAAVVGLNLGATRGEAIDTSRLETVDGGSAAVPARGDLGMAGGTLASLDAESGKLWAVRYDPRAGQPLVTSIDRQSEELAKAGADAALAVSQSGTIVATSADEGTVTTLAPDGQAFAEPDEEQLPDDAGSPTAVTTVGERVVTLDTAGGALRTLDGAAAQVPPDSVLQQPGPAASSVLVGTGTSLLEVDLDSGDVRTVAEASGGAVAPVRLGACVYGAWSGGLGAVAVRCGSGGEQVDPQSLNGKATRLAFRVNRGEIVLNDALSGTVWDVQQDKTVPIDNWEAFAPKKKNKDDDTQEQDQRDADQRPPQAKPDTYGVRPGRTSVLHPLDNDSAPDGRILSIVSVDQPGGGSRVTISPDGQTLQLQVPDEARPSSFDYFIDDGRNMQAHATVTVGLRRSDQNEKPTQREGFKPRQWRVPSGGSLSVPVLSDWRDDADGDALLLDSASAVDGERTGALARSTAEGRIRFTAPPQGDGVVRVRYGVTDGQGAPVRRTMSFLVQPTADRTGFAPVAEPDVVRGEVGRPIEIKPLANDLPGSDPTTPQADLAIGGRIPGQPHAKIATDLDKGVVTFTADKAGTYFLDYDAAYGNAPLSRSKIRVDVRPRPRRPADPVAMPDTLMVYGTSPALVDVLANDLDPSGALLVVQRAVGESDDQLDLAIVDGRWLRVSARGTLAPATQVVRYTISNGQATATGEVTVTQREQPADNTPVTATDRVVVRAGAAVTVPVLDNDASPSGDRLALRSDATERPGELDVVPPLDYKGDTGRAFVAGRMVRFVAPAAVAERETFTVTYSAVNSAGQFAPGRLVLSVIPADAPNTAPEPPTLEGRSVAGDVVTVRLPGSGIDPEGDPVAVTGISSAPRLGRLLSFTANALRYQAYPGSVGTDEFSYSVVDTKGAVATGTARVAVVPVTAPQPPLAVDDVLTVQPGRTATFDPMANDHFAAGDDPLISLVQAPEGVELDEETGLVTVPAPAAKDAPPVQVVYSLSNGIDESRATMTLRTAPDVENPPVVYDAFGNAEDSARVSVDVLVGAYDPDGRAADIRVVEVYGDPETVSSDDTRVTADRAAEPRVIPFRVEDGQGTSALAQVFVPPTGRQIPYVKPGALIEVDQGGTARGSLADYVVNPSGGRLRLTSRQGVSASPSQLAAVAEDTGSFEVSAGTGYRGPGAVLVEVTTARNDSGNEDASDASDGYTALLSIPVQVGDDTPDLDCPDAVLPIAAGEEQRIDVQSLCQVWTADPRDAAGLDYTAAFASELEGVTVTPLGGSVFSVRASEDATGGGEAVLGLRAGDSNTDQITFRLARAPQPRLLPIPVEGMKAGESRTIDLEPYLVPGVSSPSPRVVTIEQISGARAPASFSGSSVTLRPGKDVDGRVAYRVVMSDVDDGDPPASRRAEGRISFEVRGLPGAPSEPIPYENEQKGKIRVGWFPPKETGGSPIRYYQLMELTTGDTQICRQNDCYFRGLKSGVKYRFKVRARNDVDYGPWSPESIEAVVDTRPGRVRNVRMVSRGDGSITLAWDKPTLLASKITKYAITWTGGGAGVEVSGDTERAMIAGLDNNAVYTFSIAGLNKVGWSDARQSGAFQPLGTPAAPEGVTATDLNTGNAATTVRVSWADTAPNGPGPTLYTVYVSRDGEAARTVPGCDRIRATTCNDAREYDGTSYVYSVRASNQPTPEKPNVSPLSTGALFEAVGKPAVWGTWSWRATGASQEVEVSYTVPESRGDASRVDVLVDGGVAKSFSDQRGPATTRVLVAGNEEPHAVALRVCNERAPQGCTTSTTQNVQSYGPLAGALDDIGPATVNGKTLTWTITGTNNGNPSVVEVSVDGTTEVFRPGGPGRFAIQKTFTASSYNQNVGISVRLYDDDPGGRGEDRTSRGDRSGPPPAPSIGISRGASCTDGNDVPEDDCWNGKPEPPCEVASCAYAVLHVSFAPDAPQTIWRCDFEKFSAFRSAQGTGDYSGQTSAYYQSGETVKGTCRFAANYDDVTFVTTFP